MAVHAHHPSTKRLRQEDDQLEVTLDIVSHCLKKQNKNPAQIYSNSDAHHFAAREAHLLPKRSQGALPVHCWMNCW